MISFFTTSTFGQDLDTATVNGRITDVNGGTIANCSVELESSRGSTRAVRCDGSGRYRIIQIQPGTYTLSVATSGFALSKSKEFVLVAGQNLQHDITLEIATLDAEKVTIAAGDDSRVDTRRTVVGTSVNSREVSALPSPNRSFLDFLFTLPGVSEEPLSTRDLAEDRNNPGNSTPEEAGTVSLAGAPAYSNNFTIDGLDNNDDRAARERFQPPLDSIEEVQVITNQFSAEYGRASGGRINLRTRGGSPSFAGRAYYYFRDESLNANTFKNNSLGLARLPLQQHTAGFTLSGHLPFQLKQNSPLFFVAFERDQVLDSSLIDTLVPVERNDLFSIPEPTKYDASRLENAPAGSVAAFLAPYVTSVSTPLTNTSLSARIDHQFSDLHNNTLVFQLGRSNNLRQFGGGNRLADSLQAKIRNSDSIAFSDTYVLSENSINEFRLQFSRLAPAFETRSGTRPVVLITLNDSLPAEDLAKRSGTLVAGSSTSGGSERRENRVQGQEMFSHISGNHSLKFGADLHYVRSEFIDLADLTGTFSFASAGDFLLGTSSRFRQNFLSNSFQENIYAGFFFQDEWQFLPNLMLNFGLRYERERILKDNNNFGPRVSLAFRPFTANNFVLRAGAGIFYNRALLRTIDDFTLGRKRLFFDSNALVDPITGKLMNSDQRRTFLADHIHFPQTLTSESGLVKEFGSLETDFSRQLEPTLRIPESYQVNVGSELYLGKGFLLEANATFTRGIHLWREFNANAPRLPPAYANFSQFLASRDFANFIGHSGVRPIYSASTAGELVRFMYGSSTSSSANSVGRVVEAGVPVSVVNLNSPTSSVAIDAALATLNALRPDPGKAEVEELISAGNSFYRGLTVELRKQLANSTKFDISFRAGYTFSNLVDDGIVNTSDALNPGDFHAERARSLLDRRHRLTISGVFRMPNFFGRLQLSPVLRVASGNPFNISLGGADRNLDDVGNDRPNFSGDTRLLRWRKPGTELDPQIVSRFMLPSIGESGDLPRNAGRGPGLFVFDLNVAHEFTLSARLRLRPVIEFDNVLNKTQFSFGAEFINFNALSPAASAEQRQAFLDSFLVAPRTMRSRQIRAGLRLEF